MSERYLYNQQGVVREYCSLSKAVLGFKYNGEEHRVLLWVKNFVHEGEVLDSLSGSLLGKLRTGDPVTFHCHPYDKERSDDFCGWFAARAWRSLEGDEQLTVVTQQGCVMELETGRGILEFQFFGRNERVSFIRSKVFRFGHRMTTKQPLSVFMSEDDMVQFDATRCQPTPENKKCSWFARIVWKGKKPPQFSSSYADGNTGGSRTTLRNTVVGADEEGETSSSSVVAAPVTVAANISADHLYKPFEAGAGTLRNALGCVERLLSAEAGVALWMTAPNCWESVFFHRSVAFIDDICLSKYNLKESCPQETRLQISAVPAAKEFPCKWIARKVVASI